MHYDIKGMLRLVGAKFINTGEQQYVCAVGYDDKSALLAELLASSRFWGY
jgi:hypothetical protein